MKNPIKKGLIVMLLAFLVLPYTHATVKSYSFKLAIKFTGLGQKYQGVSLAEEFGQSQSSTSNYAYVTPQQFSISTANNSLNPDIQNETNNSISKNPISLASRNQSTILAVSNLNDLLKI